jgi:hypothetical protein
MNGSGSSVSVGRLIAIPAIITLLITIVRLVGELQHWPSPWVSPAAGGGAALIGISWLPFIFGPYFAWKLAAAGEGPASTGKAIGMCFAALAVYVLGGVVFFVGLSRHLSALVFVGFLIELVSAFVPRIGWRSLGNTLLAYAFAARIPVVIVMYIAMSANGGQGWGTHYDVAAPEFSAVATSLMSKFVYLAVLPQMTSWIGWTTVIGGLLGGVTVAIFHPGRRAAAAAA